MNRAPCVRISPVTGPVKAWLLPPAKTPLRPTEQPECAAAHAILAPDTQPGAGASDPSQCRGNWQRELVSGLRPPGSGTWAQTDSGGTVTGPQTPSAPRVRGPAPGARSAQAAWNRVPGGGAA